MIKKNTHFKAVGCIIARHKLITIGLFSSNFLSSCVVSFGPTFVSGVHKELMVESELLSKEVLWI